MRKFVFVLAVAILMAAPAALAAGEKIGVVNPGAVLEASAAGKTAMKQLKAFGRQQRQALKKAQKLLKTEQETLKKNIGIETKAVQERAIKRFQKHVQAFQERYQKSQEAFAKKRQALLQPLQAKLYDAIRSYAKRHGYVLILNKQAAIYNASAVDLTQPILRAFEAGAGKGKK